MNPWVDVFLVAVVGGLIRYELDSLLKRTHNRKVEEMQQAALTELRTQTMLLVGIQEAIDAIHSDIQKG